MNEPYGDDEYQLALRSIRASAEEIGCGAFPCYPRTAHSVPSVTNANFGPLVAYLVPGATVLLAFSPFSSTLQGWMALSPTDAPTIGGFLYLTVASLASGMTVSAVRWAIIDTLHARTGLRPPPLDFSRLGGKYPFLKTHCSKIKEVV